MVLFLYTDDVGFFLLQTGQALDVSQPHFPAAFFMAQGKLTALAFIDARPTFHPHLGKNLGSCFLLIDQAKVMTTRRAGGLRKAPKRG